MPIHVCIPVYHANSNADTHTMNRMKRTFLLGASIAVGIAVLSGCTSDANMTESTPMKTSEPSESLPSPKVSPTSVNPAGGNAPSADSEPAIEAENGDPLYIQLNDQIAAFNAKAVSSPLILFSATGEDSTREGWINPSIGAGRAVLTSKGWAQKTFVVCPEFPAAEPLVGIVNRTPVCYSRVYDAASGTVTGWEASASTYPAPFFFGLDGQLDILKAENTDIVTVSGEDGTYVIDSPDYGKRTITITNDTLLIVSETGGKKSYTLKPEQAQGWDASDLASGDSPGTSEPMNEKQSSDLAEKVLSY